MRAVARVVTGGPRSTPSHAMMAEAGLAPVAERRLALATRLLTKARALPEDDPLRVVAEARAPARLSSVTGWRSVGEEIWRAAGIAPPVEPFLPQPEPHGTRSHRSPSAWTSGRLSHQRRREVATFHLAALPQCATWVWTDGSASGGVTDGGAGVFIERPDGAEQEIRTPAGRLCSSFRAEMVALQAALSYLQDNPAHEDDPIVVCINSQSALH